MAEKDQRSGPGPATRELRKLHYQIGQLIVLQEANAAPRIVIDGDIEIPWPQDVKDKIAERIARKRVKIMEKVAALTNGETVE